MMHGVETEVDATWIAIIMVQILIAAVSLLRKVTLAATRMTIMAFTNTHSGKYPQYLYPFWEDFQYHFGHVSVH